MFTYFVESVHISNELVGEMVLLCYHVFKMLKWVAFDLSFCILQA